MVKIPHQKKRAEQRRSKSAGRSGDACRGKSAGRSGDACRASNDCAKRRQAWSAQHVMQPSTIIIMQFCTNGLYLLLATAGCGKSRFIIKHILMSERLYKEPYYSLICYCSTSSRSRYAVEARSQSFSWEMFIPFTQAVWWPTTRLTQTVLRRSISQNCWRGLPWRWGSITWTDPWFRCWWSLMTLRDINWLNVKKLHWQEWWPNAVITPARLSLRFKQQNTSSKTLEDKQQIFPLLPLINPCFLWSSLASFDQSLLPFISLCFLWSSLASFDQALLPLISLCFLWSILASFEKVLLPLKKSGR